MIIQFSLVLVCSLRSDQKVVTISLFNDFKYYSKSDDRKQMYFSSSTPWASAEKRQTTGRPMWGAWKILFNFIMSLQESQQGSEWKQIHRTSSIKLPSHAKRFREFPTVVSHSKLTVSKQLLISFTARSGDINSRAQCCDRNEVDSDCEKRWCETDRWVVDGCV